MTPLFHIQTLYFVGSLTAVASTVMLWSSRGLHASSRDGLVWATGSMAAFSLAMAALALRGGIPDAISVSLANIVGTGAAAFAYESVRRLTGARPMPMLAWSVIIGLTLFHLIHGVSPDTGHVSVRLYLNSIVHVVFAIAMVPLIRHALEAGRDAAAPLRWMLTVAGLFAVGHLVRMGVTMSFGARPSPTGIVEGPVQMLMPTVFALGPMVWSMILVRLVNGRLSGELWRLATVDALTGARTRRSFHESAQPALQGDGHLVLLLLDLDHFKQINDRFGHASGDRVLTRFVKVLRDVSPDGVLVGRYGGEEFCMLLRDASPDDGLRHAQRLCDVVRATEFELAPDVSVTVSIGLATKADGSTIEALLLAADRRLYHAKATGRNRVVAEDVSTLPEMPSWPVRPIDMASTRPEARAALT